MIKIMKQKKFIQVIGLATTTLLATSAAAQTTLPPETAPLMRPDPQYERYQNPLIDENATTESAEADRSRIDRQGQLNPPVVGISSLVGRDLMGQDNNKIGEIDEIYIDLQSGEILGAVVSSGGVLGFGDNKYLLHISELEFSTADESVKTNRTSGSLRTAPRYNEGEPFLIPHGS